MRTVESRRDHAPLWTVIRPRSLRRPRSDPTVRRSAFLADVQRQRLEVEGPSTRREIAVWRDRLARTPPAVVAGSRALSSLNEGTHARGAEVRLPISPRPAGRRSKWSRRSTRPGRRVVARVRVTTE